MRENAALALASCLLLGAAALAPARAESQAGGSPEARPNLVFVLPQDLDAELQNAVEDAIGTQLALVNARPILLDAPASPSPLTIEERVATSVTLAEQHDAVGVLWLDIRPTDHWFVYAMDRRAERVVVRPLLVRKESLAAGIESVSVIARASAEALVRGEPVLGEPVEVPPPRPPPPTAAPTPAPAAAPAPADEPGTAQSHELRLALGYHGETFASEQPWQSGAVVGASFLWSNGPYVGASFSWFPEHTFGDSVRFAVQRRPLSLLGGFRFRLGEHLALDAELGATLDVRSRRTVDTPVTVAARPDERRYVVSIVPRARLEALPARWLGLFAALSLDVLLNEFDYLISPSQTRPELRPGRVRLGVLAGIALLH